jgi:aldose 1-epimerase
MFSLEREKFGIYEQVKIVNNQSKEYVAVIPELGAMLNGLGLLKNGAVVELLDNCKDYESLVKEGMGHFKGSKLFPFPNRINKGEYSFNGVKYQLKKNASLEGHALHGLVYKSKFEINSFHSSGSEAVLSLMYRYSGEEPGYPFLFELNLEFILSSEGFACHTFIKNSDNEPIPVGDGWHPYFKTGSFMNNVYLKIPSNEIIALDQYMIPTGEINFSETYLTSQPVGGTAFDTCYKYPETEGKVFVDIYDPSSNLKFSIWQETGKDKYNYVQIYIPPSRNSIAVEPMSCIPDAFNNKSGLIILAPGKQLKLSFGVQ